MGYLKKLIIECYFHTETCLVKLTDKNSIKIWSLKMNNVGFTVLVSLLI